MPHVDFFIDAEKAKARPRFYRGRAITPAETKLYEDDIQRAFHEASPFGVLTTSDWTGPVSVTCDIIRRVPSSLPRWRRQACQAGDYLPLTKPDMDNVVKAILDGLAGAAYKDDKQVTAISMTRRYAELGEPHGVRVHVTYLMDLDHDFGGF